jgi:hypothetical protein
MRKGTEYDFSKCVWSVRDVISDPPSKLECQNLLFAYTQTRNCPAQVYNPHLRPFEAFLLANPLQIELKRCSGTIYRPEPLLRKLAPQLQAYLLLFECPSKSSYNPARKYQAYCSIVREILEQREVMQQKGKGKMLYAKQQCILSSSRQHKWRTISTIQLNF